MDASNVRFRDYAADSVEGTLSSRDDLVNFSEIGGGKISGSITLNETSSSLNSQVHLLAEKIDAAALNKYATLPEGFLRGQIDRLNVDGSGVLDTPHSWTGTIAAHIDNFHEGELGFD